VCVVNFVFVLVIFCMEQLWMLVVFFVGFYACKNIEYVNDSYGGKMKLKATLQGIFFREVYGSSQVIVSLILRHVWVYV
jgi:hypothetical protein